MITYVAFFRSMNVAGKNSVKMDALCTSIERLGFKHVQTYIQSGNVLFRSSQSNHSILEEQIYNRLINDFGLELAVQVKSLAKFRKIIASNPYKDDPAKNESYIHVTFLASKPSIDKLENIVRKKSDTEEFLITDEAVFLYCPDGYGKTKLTNHFLENQLCVSATTRNWKTSLALNSLAKHLEAK